MYDIARFFISSISRSSPPTKRPNEVLKTHESESSHEPGRSIKLRSVTSEPVMWRTMRLEENERSFVALVPEIAAERKASDDVDGFKIAF